MIHRFIGQIVQPNTWLNRSQALSSAVALALALVLATAPVAAVTSASPSASTSASASESNRSPAATVAVQLEVYDYPGRRDEQPLEVQSSLPSPPKSPDASPQVTIEGDDDGRRSD